MEVRQWWRCTALSLLVSGYTAVVAAARRGRQRNDEEAALIVNRQA
jgi:hypothetical protein